MLIYGFHDGEKNSAFLEHFLIDFAAEVSEMPGWEIRHVRENIWLFSPLFNSQQDAKQCSNKMMAKVGENIFPNIYQKTHGVTHSRSNNGQYRVIVDAPLFSTAYEICVKRENENGFKLSV